MIRDYARKIGVTAVLLAAIPGTGSLAVAGLVVARTHGPAAAVVMVVAGGVVIVAGLRCRDGVRRL